MRMQTGPAIFGKDFKVTGDVAETLKERKNGFAEPLLN